MASTNRFARAREDHAREMAEDYVELVLQLTEEFSQARTVEMARRLQVSQPTVTKTLIRLEKEGLLVIHPRRYIELTAEGLEIARRSKARHQMVVAFLKAIGVDDVHAELDAEGIEHHVGEQTLSAMKRYLGRS